MELRVLRYFLAVVREESITAAAKSLHLTQPTLSRQLMELEEELGTQLLIRGGRNQKITLTEKGMLLRRRAQELVELADKAQSEMGSDEIAVSGDVSIGGGETQGMRLVAKATKQLQQAYPAIRYHLYSGNAEDVKERLDKGLLDFGVFIGLTNLDQYEYFSLPTADTWGLLMQKGDPLAQKRAITPDDLPGLPLLVSRQRMGSNPFSEWLGGDSSVLRVVATYNLVYNASLMVSEGVGYAICLNKLVNTSGADLCFVPLAPQMTAGIRFAWKKYQPFTKAAELFLDRMRKLCS